MAICIPAFIVRRAEPLVHRCWILTLKAGRSFRLLTEAEWEYGCRAGTSTIRFWGHDPSEACQYANTHDRRSKLENPIAWPHHDCDIWLMFYAKSRTTLAGYQSKFTSFDPAIDLLSRLVFVKALERRLRWITCFLSFTNRPA